MSRRQLVAYDEVSPPSTLPPTPPTPPAASPVESPVESPSWTPTRPVEAASPVWTPTKQDAAPSPPRRPPTVPEALLAEIGAWFRAHKAKTYAVDGRPVHNLRAVALALKASKLLPDPRSPMWIEIAAFRETWRVPCPDRETWRVLSTMVADNQRMFQRRSGEIVELPSTPVRRARPTQLAGRARPVGPPGRARPVGPPGRARPAVAGPARPVARGRGRGAARVARARHAQPASPPLWPPVGSPGSPGRPRTLRSRFRGDNFPGAAQ